MTKDMRSNKLLQLIDLIYEGAFPPAHHSSLRPVGGKRWRAEGGIDDERERLNERHTGKLRESITTNLLQQSRKWKYRVHFTPHMAV